MTNAAQRVKALIQGMTEDRKHYQTLGEMLMEQRHHIIARNAASLDSVNAQIMALYQQISHNSQQRRRLLEQLGITASGEGMKTLIARLPSSHQAPVAALWQTLRKQVEDCQHRNEYNGTLMNMQHDILQNLLNSSEPENWLYQQI